jgi:hypothetical protein
VFVLGGSVITALADDRAAPHQLTAKSLQKSVVGSASSAHDKKAIGRKKGSNRGTPIVDGVEPSKLTKTAPGEPKGSLSLDLKWHATNDRPDPFDAVTHTSGPNGSGDAFLGGVKLGF